MNIQQFIQSHDLSPNFRSAFRDPNPKYASGYSTETKITISSNFMGQVLKAPSLEELDSPTEDEYEV